jgi:hypothetical protein
MPPAQNPSFVTIGWQKQYYSVILSITAVKCNLAAGKSKFYYSLGDAVNCTSLDGKSGFYYLLGDAVNCTSFDGILYSLLPPRYRGCPSIPCW